MPTENTTSENWYYYVRLKGRNFYLGIVDTTGTAPATAGLDIDVFYSQFPNEIESDNDIIGLPEEYLFALAKSVASEIIKMNGQVTNLTQQFDLEWERIIYDGTHAAVDNASQPMIQRPLDLRNT